MRRRREHRVRIADLDQPAEIHDADAVGDVAHDRQVVGDHQIAEPVLALQVVHQVQDLALDRDVKPGRGLVGDHQLRPQRQRPCHAHPPRLPARQLVRVAVEEIARQPHHVDQALRLALDLTATGAVDDHWFGKQAAHRLARAQ